MPSLPDDTWETRTVRVDKRPMTVLQSPDGQRFRVGCIGTIDVRGRAFAVRWKEVAVTTDASGAVSKAYVKRRQAVSSLPAAVALLLEVNARHDAGEVYAPEREKPVATLRAVAEAYVRASAEGRPAATARFRASLLQRFLAWAGDDRRVSDLTRGLLADYGDHLRAEEISSVGRYVGVVEQAWAWAWSRDDQFPGVPEPRRITGADGDIPNATHPVATDTPTWAEVDAMIGALTPEGATAWMERLRAEGQGELRGFGYRPQWEVHRRVALVQRYTGLRISQILSLEAADLDVVEHRLVIRAGRAGAKGQRRDRVVPLHPALAASLAAWGLPDAGPVFTRTATKGARAGVALPLEGKDVADVFTAAWQRAGVPASKWGASAGREKARPTNAVRARWKSTIAGAGSYELATMMVGQSTRGEHDAYVAMGNPTASPYWASMCEALAAIPPFEAGS